MNRRKPSSLRAFLLLCLLATGPLQAQVAFACAMMDTVIHDECCCDDPGIENDGLNAEGRSAPESGQIPCCELSVEINVDRETREHNPLVKPPDQRSDGEPPQGLLASFDVLFPAAALPAPRNYSSDRIGIHAGSCTYLVTRRLRI